jgi:rhodanese-related sulfurtransferase
MPRSIAASPSSRVALLALIGSLGAPLVIDVRRAPAFAADPGMIPGAIRRAPEDVADWAPQLAAIATGKAVVVYCVHGHEVSQNTAAHLRTAGIDATYLEGGIEDWKTAGAPTMRKIASLGLDGSAPSGWITRERPKIDRIACPWLVQRFIDPLATFHYVPAESVSTEATFRNAIPYDIPGVQFSHRGDQGERCSFDAMLDDFGLEEPALRDLAVIVRGADTGHPELTPQSPGLLALSLGLSANFPDDHEMLAHGMVMYDALYAWLRTARAEEHNAKLFAASAGARA